MPLDPDTEIQYRKGGKIMKKMPRKFSAGGVPPADAEAAKQDAKVKREREAYEKARPTMLGPRTAEKPPAPEKPPVAKKKGGKVRKFEGGDMVTLDTRERRADERKEPAPIENRTQPEKSTKDTGPSEAAAIRAEREGSDVSLGSAYPTGRFGDDTYRKAYAQANRLTTPDGKVEKEVKAQTGLKEPSVSIPKRVTPKAASRLKPGNDAEPYARREEQTEPQITPKKDYGERGNMYGDRVAEAVRRRMINPRFSAPETDPAKMSDMDRYFHNKAKKDAEERKARAERAKRESEAATAAKGIAVYKKGGGIESKGKTKGKIVKMAKGGSVRGYGISKVTNKTKYV